MRNVTAILVSHNSARVIGAALASLVGEAHIASIIVVDNASTDETCDVVRRNHPTVELIENGLNDGFGRANNLALAKVKTPYALLVNPDAVLGPGAVGLLVEAAQRYEDAAILAPALYDKNGKRHKSFKRSVFEREKSSFPHRGKVRKGAFSAKYLRGSTGRPPLDLPPARGEEIGDLCAEFLSGAVMFWNMALMRQVGFFDPNIFLYYEDDDICLRARAAGYGLVYVPAAKAVHLMGASGDTPSPESEAFRQKHMTWSRLYIEEKYRGRAAALALVTTLKRRFLLHAFWYRLCRNRKKMARYDGRLAAIAAFNPSGQCG